jgi:hypothetical protein
MPLTALHAETGRLVDATLEIAPDSGPGWADVYRRPDIHLVCPECAGRIAARCSPRGLRFFAHHRRPEHCKLAGESLAHHLLKLELVTAARAVECWTAELEANGPDGPWRADVLAVGPDGRKLAFEAQLAAATDDELERRTRRYAEDDVEVCWVTDKDVPWVARVPSARLQPPDSAPVAEGTLSRSTEQLWVVDGAARWLPVFCRGRCCDLRVPWGRQIGAACPGHGYWETPRVTLTQFVATVCSGASSAPRAATRLGLWCGSAARMPPLMRFRSQQPIKFKSSSTKPRPRIGPSRLAMSQSGRNSRGCRTGTATDCSGGLPDQTTRPTDTNGAIWWTVSSPWQIGSPTP